MAAMGTAAMGTAAAVTTWTKVVHDESWLGIGLAYSPSARRIADRCPELVDHLEIPFELIRAEPSLLDSLEGQQVLLHSASLSLAGALPLDRIKVDELAAMRARLSSPWISEHAAFIDAPNPHAPQHGVYESGFTIAPSMNADVALHIATRLDSVYNMVGYPVLIENSPLYFESPGSDLSYPDFFRLIVENSPAMLLLDLTHLVISARNLGFDADEALHALPRDRITQLHLSGIETVEGIAWDNHASAVPEDVLRLVAPAMAAGGVRAVTLEYNWISAFTDEAVVTQLGRVRNAVTHATSQLA